MTQIMVFETLALAQACNAAIDALAAPYWQGLGFTVTNGELVPKNAATGQDDLSAQRVTTWAIPLETPEGKWWITSLTGTEFEPAMIDLRAAHTFTEIEMPNWGDAPP
jgi:hypothetical protein